MRDYIFRFVISLLGLLFMCLFIFLMGSGAFKIIAIFLFFLGFVPPAFLLYHLRKGVREENGLIHLPFVFGNATLIRSQIKGFVVERGFWDHLMDTGRLTVYNKGGQEFTFLLPDYMIREVVKNKDLILQS